MSMAFVAKLSEFKTRLDALEKRISALEGDETTAEPFGFEALMARVNALECKPDPVKRGPGRPRKAAA